MPAQSLPACSCTVSPGGHYSASGPDVSHSQSAETWSPATQGKLILLPEEVAEAAKLNYL